MLSPSLREQIKGRWREFCREPSAMFFVIMMPILWMTILGFAISEKGIEVYGVGWPEENDDSGIPSVLDTKLLLEQDRRIKLHVGDDATLETLLKRGEILTIVRPEKHSVNLRYDPTNGASVRASWLVADLAQRAAGREDVLTQVDEEITIPGSRYVDFLIPGLLALSIMTSSLFGTGMTIVSNRRENLLKRYLATPMRPYEYIVSHIVGRGFILAVEGAAILIAGYAIFRFAPAGPFFDLVLFAALGAAAFTALALLCSSRTSNAAAMMGVTNLIMIPMMLVSGVWFSRSGFPEWLAVPTRYLPLTALTDGLRRIALEGVGITSAGPEAAILLAYLIVCTVLAKTLFKWY